MSDDLRAIDEDTTAMTPAGSEAAAQPLSHMTRAAVPPVTDMDMLLSFAWLGELTTEHVRRLHFPHMSQRTVERRLSSLVRDGYLEIRRRGVSDVEIEELPDGTVKERTITRGQMGARCLTARGHDAIKRLDAYPARSAKAQYAARAAKVRDPILREHDLMLSDLVVHLITQARSIHLSGVFVGRELRLDPARPNPLMDALIVLHFERSHQPSLAVPWTKDLATRREESRRYAVELDTGTEAPAILRQKAAQYAAVLQSGNTRFLQWWESLYGRWPIVLLLVPDEARLRLAWREWSEEWPSGRFAVATMEGMAADR